jgi:hypothetical protein
VVPETAELVDEHLPPDTRNIQQSRVVAPSRRRLPTH